MFNILKGYVIVFLFFTLLFIFFFQINLFSFQNVLFYKGFLLLIVTSIICLVGIGYLVRFKKHSAESLFAALVLSFSINLTFFVIFPVTVERSVTTFMLSSIAKGNSNLCIGLTKDQIQKSLVNDYIIGRHAVDKRIHEQTIINTIKEHNQCVQLTQRGSNFLKFAEVIKRMYKF